MSRNSNSLNQFSISDKSFFKSPNVILQVSTSFKGVSSSWFILDMFFPLKKFMALVENLLDLRNYLEIAPLGQFETK